MHIPLKSVILSSAPLKIFSLILGFLLWLVLSQSQVMHRWFTVPVYFYNIPANTTIEAPEVVDVQLTGKRSALMTVDQDTLALHVDALKWTNGKHNMNFAAEHLFLPERIKLVNYHPANCYVEVTTTDKQV